MSILYVEIVLYVDFVCRDSFVCRFCMSILYVDFVSRHTKSTYKTISTYKIDIQNYLDIYMLFTGWEVRIVKNCDRGLENAARGRRPRAAFSRQRS